MALRHENSLRYGWDAGDYNDGLDHACRLEKIWLGTCFLRGICGVFVGGRSELAYYATFDADTVERRILDGGHDQSMKVRTDVWRMSGDGSGADQLWIWSLSCDHGQIRRWIQRLLPIRCLLNHESRQIA